MTTTKPIHELLQMTALDYAEASFEKYMRWCHATLAEKETGPNVQQLLGNKSIANWYNLEFEKLEVKFVKMIGNTHTNMGIEQIRQIYVAVTSHIFTYYPQHLVNLAKHVNVGNQIDLAQFRSISGGAASYSSNQYPTHLISRATQINISN